MKTTAAAAYNYEATFSAFCAAERAGDLASVQAHGAAIIAHARQAGVRHAIARRIQRARNAASGKAV